LEWLARFKDTPVRFLIAPPGFGKTVALLEYFHNIAKGGSYCTIPESATPAAIWNAIANGLGDAPAIRSHDELLHTLAARVPFELALDCQDLPDAQGLAAILRLIDDAPPGLSLLVASRSRAAFGVRQLVAEGTAVLCDAERLAFDAAEVRQIAESCDVHFANGDVIRLLERTDGWPRVISTAVRKAAEDGCTLDKALDNWRSHRRHIFEEFVTSAWANPPKEKAALVAKLLDGVRIADVTHLKALEEDGFFVVYQHGELRPLRPLARGRNAFRHSSRDHVAAPMEVRCLGWFRAEVAGRAIEWIRRRDHQVFAYVCLQHDGRASREAIVRAFWPGTEIQLARQSLRTVCANIRRAIAETVGNDAVGEYFNADDDVSINTANVLVDVQRFLHHVADGDDQYALGSLRSAYQHYRLASRVYGADLLIGDAREAWASPVEANLRARYESVIKRLAEMLSATERPANLQSPQSCSAITPTPQGLAWH